MAISTIEWYKSISSSRQHLDKLLQMRFDMDVGLLARLLKRMWWSEIDDCKRRTQGNKRVKPVVYGPT